MNSLFSSKFWLAICLCLTTISTANAGIFKTANWEGTTQFGTFQTVVGLGNDTSGNTLYSLNVNAPVAGNYILTYSSVCWVYSSFANNPYASVEIDIVLNGLPYQPTVDTTDIMCSSRSDTPYTDKARATYTIALPLKAGMNTIAIYGRVIGSGVQGGLGHSRLVIYR